MRDALMFVCGAVFGGALMFAFCQAVVESYVRERREAKARRLDLLKLHARPTTGGSPDGE